MSSKIRTFKEGQIYHIYNRGTQKMRLFYDKRDYEYFIDKIKKYKQEFPIKIIHSLRLFDHLVGEI